MSAILSDVRDNIMNGNGDLTTSMISPEEMKTLVTKMNEDLSPLGLKLNVDYTNAYNEG